MRLSTELLGNTLRHAILLCATPVFERMATLNDTGDLSNWCSSVPPLPLLALTSLPIRILELHPSVLAVHVAFQPLTHTPPLLSKGVLHGKATRLPMTFHPLRCAAARTIPPSPRFPNTVLVLRARPPQIVLVGCPCLLPPLPLPPLLTPSTPPPRPLVRVRFGQKCRVPTVTFSTQMQPPSFMARCAANVLLVM